MSRPVMKLCGWLTWAAPPVRTVSSSVLRHSRAVHAIGMRRAPWLITCARLEFGRRVVAGMF